MNSKIYGLTLKELVTLVDHLYEESDIRSGIWTLGDIEKSLKAVKRKGESEQRLTEEEFRQRVNVLFDCAYAWQADDEQNVVLDPMLEEIRPLVESAWTLLQYLKESHSHDIKKDYYGDGPAGCSYCRLIAEFGSPRPLIETSITRR